MASILHIGLPLRLPWLTADDSVKIAARLSSIRQSMEAVGHRYTVMHSQPADGLKDFRRWLQTEPCDVVVIGGGVAADPQLSAFKQQIINAAKEEAPAAKVIEFDHSIDMQTLVDRALSDSTAKSKLFDSD